MKTTITINDQLFADAMKVAARSGRTVDAVVEDALRSTFARQEAQRHRGHITLPTHAGGPFQPGADSDSYAALLDLMNPGER